MKIKTIVYLLFYIMLVGNILDYLTTYYYLNAYGFEYEKNELVTDNKSLLTIKSFALFVNFAIVGLHYVIEDKLPKKLKRFFQIINVICFLHPTFMLWKAVFFNFYHISLYL